MSTDNKTTSDHALRVATAYHEAWTSGDLDKAMSFMTDDVVVHVPGKEINGKEEYRAYLGGFMEVMEGCTPPSVTTALLCSTTSPTPPQPTPPQLESAFSLSQG